MKIVNKKEFYELPENTIYSQYKSGDFYYIFIKGETIYDRGNPCDYYKNNLLTSIDCDSSGEFFDILIEATENKKNFSLDFDVEGRNGMYDNDQLYAIWEKDDLEKLIKVLQKGFNGNN